MVISLVVAVSLAPSSTWQESELQLHNLAADRGAYLENWVSPEAEKLQVLEWIGTNNLGNPWREWYFPVGSSSSKIWIINWYSDTGSLVKQSKHGKYTETDWVLDLKYDPTNYGPKPKGTFALILWNLGYEVNGPTNSEQSALLEGVHSYAGYMYTRGPIDSDVIAWYVHADGRLRPYFGVYASSWSVSKGISSPDLSSFVNPPITLEEADELGIETFNGWQHPSVTGVRYEKLRWTDRPYGSVPGRSGG